MNALSPFLFVDRPCDETLHWLSQRLSQGGLRLMQTFDLQDARPRIEDCPCPHHGTSRCDCQMVVVLVYGNAAEPATLILHGHDGQTWLSLIDTPLQHPATSIQTSIERALQANFP